MPLGFKTPLAVITIVAISLVRLCADVSLLPRKERGYISEDASTVVRLLSEVQGPFSTPKKAVAEVYKFEPIRAAYVKLKTLQLSESLSPEALFVFPSEGRLVALDDHFYGKGKGPSVVVIYDMNDGKVLIKRSLEEILGENVNRLPETSTSIVWRTREPIAYEGRIFTNNQLQSADQFPQINDVISIEIDVASLNVSYKITPRKR